MICMFMGNKNRFYFLHGKVQALHPFFDFPAGNAHVYQYGFVFVAYVIAVAVASGI
jgi:hypothetical protein